MVTGVVPSPPWLLPSIFIAHRVQQFHCSSIFHRVLLTHAFALSASQFVHKKKFPRICTSMHSGGFELTKLTYNRLEGNLIRHRGDRFYCMLCQRAKTGRGRCGWGALGAEHELQREEPAVLCEGPVQPRLPPRQRKIACRRRGRVRVDDDRIGEKKKTFWSFIFFSSFFLGVLGGDHTNKVEPHHHVLYTFFSFFLSFLLHLISSTIFALSLLIFSASSDVAEIQGH